MGFFSTIWSATTLKNPKQHWEWFLGGIGSSTEQSTIDQCPTMAKASSTMRQRQRYYFSAVTTTEDSGNRRRDVRRCRNERERPGIRYGTATCTHLCWTLSHGLTSFPLLGPWVLVLAAISFAISRPGDSRLHCFSTVSNFARRLSAGLFAGCPCASLPHLRA